MYDRPTTMTDASKPLAPPPPPPPPQPHDHGQLPPPPAYPVYSSAEAAPLEGPHPALALLVALAATAAAMIVMLTSKEALAERDVDDKHVFVQIALFAVAGLGWALIQPGRDRLLRAVLGTAAGAGTGLVGALLLGSIEQHNEAFADAVFSGGSFGRAALWALVGAAAWTITITPGTVRDRRPQAAAGAALGGAATGATMGLLAGTFTFGDSIIPTDVWLTFPFADTGEAMRSLPVLLGASVVPLLLAATSARAARAGTIVAAGVAACLLLPALGGLAGYSTELDEARRDGADLDIAANPDLDAGDGGDSGSGSSSADESPSNDDVVVAEPATSDPSDDDDGGNAEAGPALSLPQAPTAPPAPTVPPAPTTRVPAPRPPATTPATVPSTVDPGYPVFISSEILASNERRQTATTYLLVGRPYHGDRAPAQVDGGVTCPADSNDAVIPFYLSSTPTSGGSANKVTLLFSQSRPGVADVEAHPITMEFHDAGNGRRCVSATSPDLTTTEAVYEWRNVAGGEEVSGNGYFIIADYFGPGDRPVGRRSAVMAVFPRVNDLYTTNTFTLTGAELVRFKEPETGERVAAMRLVH